MPLIFYGSIQALLAMAHPSCRPKRLRKPPKASEIPTKEVTCNDLLRQKGSVDLIS